MLSPVSMNATRTAATIARLVLLEARRTRLAIMVGIALAAGLGLAGFLSKLALTEGAALQAAVLAAFFRATAVFIVAGFVTSSMVREANDKGTELLLSLPISRTSYFLGKLSGYAAVGALISALFALALLGWGSPPAVALWFISLFVETTLVASVSLFFVITLGDVLPALAGTAGLYFLGRTIGAFQSIAASPLIGDESGTQRLAGWAVGAIALFLPPLDRATQTSWILYGPPSGPEFVVMAAGMALYCALVVFAGLFDFHRRNL